MIQCGSGVLFQIGSMRFIFTAAHILDLFSVFQFPLYAGAMEKNGRPIRLAGAEFICSYHDPKLDPKADFEDLRKKDSDPFDSGIIILTDALADKIGAGRRFATLDDCDPETPHNDGLLLVSGFPTEMTNTKIKEKILEINPLSFLTTFTEPKTDERSIAMHLKYAWQGVATDGSEVELPKLDGISGCGVWRLSETKPFEQWSLADVKLVGVEHAWIKETRTVLATPIAAPLLLIKREFPKLGWIMEVFLGKVVHSWTI